MMDMKAREALCMSQRLSLIAPLRDEGIFSLKMLTPSLAGRVLPKAPFAISSTPVSRPRYTPTVDDEMTKLKQEEKQRYQYKILSQRREKLNKERMEKVHAQAQMLTQKAKDETGKRKSHLHCKIPPAKLTKEEEQKLEKLVAFIEAKSRNKPKTLLFKKLRHRFKPMTAKEFLLKQCVSEMSPHSELIYPHNSPALFETGCITCGKSNVKVLRENEKDRWSTTGKDTYVCFAGRRYARRKTSWSISVSSTGISLYEFSGGDTVGIHRGAWELQHKCGH